MKRVLAFALVLCGCGSFRTMTAGSGDLADYREFRVAAAEGTRLARAKAYLDRHPNGAFSAEVRAAYEEEEPRFYEAAQGSREATRRYLADLPDGPHAVAALALLTALEQTVGDAELRDIGRQVRYNDAKLETAAQQRRAVGESILGAVGVLLADGVYGVKRSDGPPELRTLLLGHTETTWGFVPARRDEDLYFLIPTRPERESRLLTLEIAVVEKDGLVTGGSVEGSDMLVRWAEADQIVKLDPSSLDDRTEAAAHAMDRLGGALEARFPSATCPDLRQGSDLYRRACSGWSVAVTAGAAAGDKDSIVVGGPDRRVEPR